MIFWSLNTNGKYEILQPFTLDDRYTGSTTTSPSLVINDVVEEDTGNYTCHAVNILGVAFGKPIQFTIKGLGKFLNAEKKFIHLDLWHEKRA